MSKSVSVVIPSFNGRPLLEKNLPALVRASATHDAPVEIIIVDDAGNDDTASFIRANYPETWLHVNDENLGFAESVNKGISIANHEIILTLNNDVLVEEDIFAKTLHWFNDPDVFSVTPNMVDPRENRSQAITRLKPGICWFRTVNLQLLDVIGKNCEIPLFFASGGASFFCRQKLLLLNGFDPIYRPFYVEDMDLSYRAWKAGWKCLMEPATTVYHETSSTIRSLNTKWRVKLIGDRNRTLFLWLNITDSSLIIQYFLFLPLSMLYDIFAFRKYKFLGFFRALKYLPSILKMRKKRKAYFVLRDEEVLKKIA